MLNTEKKTVSPVQTKNEQRISSVFMENFKKLYLQQPLETILEHFAECHIRLCELEQLEIDREEQLMMLIRTEVYHA